MSIPSNALTNYSYEGFQPPIIQYDTRRRSRTASCRKNLANTLVIAGRLPAGAVGAELELEPTVNQQYQQIYQTVTGGA